MTAALKTGVENLVTKHRPWLDGKNIALLSHAAAVDAEGHHSAELLLRSGAKLKALFGPEHGFDSLAAPGKKVTSSAHKRFKIPIHSLYGPTRKPTPDMLKNLNTIVIDLQNIPARPYTYLATMLNVMQSAAECGLQIIVADRPVPLPNTIDGPSLQKDFDSFVAPVDIPMAYGMTLGETALWLARSHSIDIDLRVARMTGYNREEYPQPGWPAWVKPSPAITSWDSALCYLTTLSTEAIPALTNCRNESLSFQAITASWLNAEAVCAQVAHVRGIQLHPIPENQTILIEVTSPMSVKPVKLGIAILAAIQKVHGAAKLWNCKGVRPDFFDKLFGGSAVRRSLQKSQSANQIASRWKSGIARFQRQRLEILLYKRKSST